MFNCSDNFITVEYANLLFNTSISLSLPFSYNFQLFKNNNSSLLEEIAHTHTHTHIYIYTGLKTTLRKQKDI